MKKAMLAAVVAFTMVCGVYAADEAKADAKVAAPAVKTEATCPMAATKACEACAKVAKDAKEGEKAKACEACTKKCEAKAEVKAEKKTE